MAAMRELTPDQEIQHAYLLRKTQQVRETLEDQLPEGIFLYEAMDALFTVERMALHALTVPEVIIEPLNHPDIRQDTHA